ncbi:ATP-grasp fold amidoligase family protein [Alteribacter aurantiacus]|uniref:ATP-grasp fold amidoligase family protein n=1 Tax=Alteribacter aurantiacus TaxID=254410 RepID=UPI00040D567B|nr:ATP-grasp fold amidoligase family protein [Alteribacter aurantiacus]
MKQDKEVQRMKDEKRRLTEALYKKEAELNTLQAESKDIQKRTNQIEQSRLWKVLRPFMKIKCLFRSFYSKGKAELKDLQRINDELGIRLKEKERSIQELQVTLTSIQSELDKLTCAEVEERLKNAKMSGFVFEYIDSIVSLKERKVDELTSALHFSGRLFRKDSYDLQEIAYGKIISGMRTGDVPEFIVRHGEGKNGLSLEPLSSFREEMTKRARKRQLNKLPESILDNKKHAYSFVSGLGIKHPWISEAYDFYSLPDRSEVVIKPVEGAGSRGVYLVKKDSEILDIKRSRTLVSREELKVSMAEDLGLNWVIEDKWMMEELIFEDKQKGISARDLKFYTFYGEIALILEVVRTPSVKYCWWYPDGRKADTGKYSYELFEGNGVTEEDLRVASMLSTHVPAPFIRIDFLKTKEGLVFGEFTPKPGNYDEFNRKTDQKLGEAMLRAENRLLQDLLEGKKFDSFHKNLS